MVAGYMSILLIVLLCNTGIYFYLKTTLIQRQMDNVENYLSYVCQQIDMQMSEIKKNMHKFLEDTEDWSGEKFSDTVNSQQRLIKDLIYMMTSNQMIEFVAVYDDDQPIVVTNEGTCTKDVLVREIQRNTTLSLEEISEDINTNREFNYFPVNRLQDPVLVFYTGVSYVQSRNMKIIVFLDSAQIQSAFADSTIEDYAQVYIVNSDFETLFSRSGDGFDKNLITNSGDYDGYSMIVKESDFQDWLYISVLDDQRIVQDLNFVKNIFLILLSLMMAICIILCIGFVKRYYTPISDIVDNYMLTLGKNTDELAAISDTMDFLMEKEQQSEEKEILSGILQSGFYEKDIDSLFEYDSFRIVVLRGKHENVRETSVIKEFFAGEQDVICKVVYNQHNGCTLILNGNDLNYHRTFAILMDLQKTLLDKYDVFVAFGASDICEQIMDLHDAYRDALQAFDFGDSSQENCIYIKQELTEANQRIYMPIDFERNMTERIYVRNYDGIRTLIEDVFKRNRGVSNVYLHNVIMSMCSAYENICKKLGNTSKLSSDIINNEYRVPVIKQHLVEIFTGLEGDMLKENRAEAVRNYVTMYVAEHYSDPTVSIELIADEIHLSASYVSTLFKKSMGIAFSQYLLQYRIDVAKELLVSSREKISVISEKSGFGTYNNFVRMFKRKTGLSPSQYRAVNRRIGGEK